MGLAYSSTQGATGTLTLNIPAAPNATWNLTALTISMSGPTQGPNAKVTVFDGAVGGTVLYAEFLPGPGATSVGNTVACKIPLGPSGTPALQGTPGNAMNIVVIGTGVNQVIINARVTDGLTS